MKQFLRAIELMLGVGWVGQPGVRGRLAETLVRDALAAILKDLG
jgi:hypothetical protein